jgi:acyl-CoA thioesterase-1
MTYKFLIFILGGAILILTAAAGISGCTQESSDTGQSGRKRPVVLFLGDSLTDGYTLGSEKSYPALIQQKINAAGLNFYVVNGGKSGDTAEEALQRLPDFLNAPISVFMVALGANDASRNLPIPRTETALRSILSLVQKRHPNARLIVAGIEPLRPVPADFETEFRRMFARVADDFSATLIPSLLEGVAGDSTLNLADGIHPNENGAIKISKTLWPHLLLILKTGDGDPQ